MSGDFQVGYEEKILRMSGNAQIAREVVVSPSLEVLKKKVGMALMDVV